MHQLTIYEFRFLQQALRGGMFDFYTRGSHQKALILDEMREALNGDGNVDVTEIDVELLQEKVRSMSGPETALLIDRLNQCYFAEVIAFAESMADKAAEDRH